MAKLLFKKNNKNIVMEVTKPNRQIRIINRIHTFLEKYPVAAALGYHITTLKFITQCDEITQMRAKKTIELCISSISQKINKKNKPSFALTCEAISVLPRITHELRHAHQTNHSVLQRLVAHMKEMCYSNKTLIVEEYLQKHIGMILSALFASQIDFYRHFQFFIDLSMFYIAKGRLFQPNNKILLWKASALISCTQKTDKRFIAFFDDLTTSIIQEQNAPEASPFQRALANDLETILSPDALANIKQEYLVGAYFLDLAFPKYKLNIEADGSFYHCIGGKTYQCKFLVRDYILTHLFGWKVIRISSRDYFKNNSKAKRNHFLSHRLKDFPELLQNKKATIPRAEIREPNSRKKFLGIDELDIHSKHFNFMLKKTTQSARFFTPKKKTGYQTKLVITSSPFSQEPVIKLKKKRVRKQRTF